MIKYDFYDKELRGKTILVQYDDGEVYAVRFKGEYRSDMFNTHMRFLADYELLNGEGDELIYMLLGTKRYNQGDYFSYRYIISKKPVGPYFTVTVKEGEIDF